MMNAFYRNYAKRAVDAAVALGLLVLLSPLLVVLAATVASFLGAPVLFRQTRPGRGGRLFVLYKFRTMTDRRDARGELLPDGDRLTRFGRWLRSTSLDELPSLWNVLRGEMSLVGPRPLLPEYLELYTPTEARRHQVRPGITGWAQIHGRNAVGWEDRFARDVWYVDHCGFLLDCRILFRTLVSVLRREGIAPPGGATMPKLVRRTAPRREHASTVVGGST